MAVICFGLPVAPPAPSSAPPPAAPLPPDPSVVTREILGLDVWICRIIAGAGASDVMGPSGIAVCEGAGGGGGGGWDRDGVVGPADQYWRGSTVCGSGEGRGGGAPAPPLLPQRPMDGWRGTAARGDSGSYESGGSTEDGSAIRPLRCDRMHVRGNKRKSIQRTRPAALAAQTEPTLTRDIDAKIARPICLGRLVRVINVRRLGRPAVMR